jgi:hypothetical protein
VGALLDASFEVRARPWTAPTLATFARSLRRVGSADRALARGARAWLDYVTRLRGLQAPWGSVCRPLRKWREHRFALASAPIDVLAYDRSQTRLRLIRTAVRRGAVQLRRLGAEPHRAKGFELFLFPKINPLGPNLQPLSAA